MDGWMDGWMDIELAVWKSLGSLSHPQPGTKVIIAGISLVIVLI